MENIDKSRVSRRAYITFIGSRYSLVRVSAPKCRHVGFNEQTLKARTPTTANQPIVPLPTLSLNPGVDRCELGLAYTAATTSSEDQRKAKHGIILGEIARMSLRRRCSCLRSPRPAIACLFRRITEACRIGGWEFALSATIKFHFEAQPA